MKGLDNWKDCTESPLNTLRAHGIGLTEAVKNVQFKARHTAAKAREAGYRRGGLEWRFSIQTPATTYRASVIIDNMPIIEVVGIEEYTPKS